MTKQYVMATSAADALKQFGRGAGEATILRAVEIRGDSESKLFRGVKKETAAQWVVTHDLKKATGVCFSTFSNSEERYVEGQQLVGVPISWSAFRKLHPTIQVTQLILARKTQAKAQWEVIELV